MRIVSVVNPTRGIRGNMPENPSAGIVRQVAAPSRAVATQRDADLFQRERIVGSGNGTSSLVAAQQLGQTYPNRHAPISVAKHYDVAGDPAPDTYRRTIGIA